MGGQSKPNGGILCLVLATDPPLSRVMVFDEWTNAIVGYRICHGKMFEHLKIFEAFSIFEAMENESICSDRTECHGQVRLS